MTPEIKKFGFAKEFRNKVQTGLCQICGKECEISELRLVWLNPQQRMYVCEKCDFKNNMRKHLNMRPKW